MAKPLAHSYSSLNDYKNCPLNFYEKRIAKSYKDVQSIAAKHGEKVHKDFENYVKDGTPLPPELARWAPVLDHFKKYPVLCEQEMVLDDTLSPIIDSPNPWWDDRAWFRSKLDVLVFPSETHAVVLDYKTGAKHRPDYDQMEIFAGDVFKFYPTIQTVTAMLIWTQFPDITDDVRTFQRAQANELWVKPISVIRNIYTSLENNNWPAKPSGLCGWCGHEPNCPHALKRRSKK